MTNDISRQGSFNIYQGMLERSLLQVKMASAERLSKDIAKLNEKYDGKAAARVEDQINRLGGDKAAVADWLRRVDTGLKAMNDIRVWMLEMKAAVGTGSGAAFDNALDKNNYDVNRAGYSGDSLIANPRRGLDYWKQRTEVVSSGGLSAEITNRFLGNDYVIHMDGGGVFKPGKDSTTVVGDGKTFTTSAITLDSFDSATDRVTFTADGVQYSGTVSRGGLGVLPAWLYGNFADETSKERARTDLAAGFKKLARAEMDYNLDQAALSGIDLRLKQQMDELGEKYRKISQDELNAKQAERRALQTRFDIFNNSLALTSSQGQQMIYHMFMTKPTYEKPTMTDIMMNSARGV